ncbi:MULTISPECIES: J domain-containing protein [unclassified Mameliella]|uniref:J domain-containing protein n=1 Tax=unclassified Mameliella TaxID=2630630 RepID=UPI00273D8090|nr:MULTISPECIES: J domain-containing protein [unclassified Mameliella]
MTRTAPMSAYKTLGVTPEDDFATIRRAWIRLVKAHHPDVIGGDIEEGARKLAELNDAYDALRWHNPEKLRIIAEREARDRRDDQGDPAPLRKAPAEEARADNTQADLKSQARHEAGPQDASHPQQEAPRYERRETLWADFISARAQERFRAGQRICTPASQVARRRMLCRA